MWKRQVYQDLAHGVKVFDLFAFESSISGYTCDYVDIDGGSCECSSVSIFFQAESQRDKQIVAHRRDGPADPERDRDV